MTSNNSKKSLVNSEIEKYYKSNDISLLNRNNFALCLLELIEHNAARVMKKYSDISSLKDDIIQETFIVVFQKIKDKKFAVGNIEGYISAILRSKAVDFINSEQRNNTVSFDSKELEELQNDIYEDSFLDLDANRILDVLKGLIVDAREKLKENTYTSDIFEPLVFLVLMYILGENTNPHILRTLPRNPRLVVKKIIFELKEKNKELLI